MTSDSLSTPTQDDFKECYRGRQSALHHAAYMRMAKVLLALQVCEKAGISLDDKDIFDYGFGAGTFFRYCPPHSRLFGVEMDAENVDAVHAMLRERGCADADLQTIEIERWREHPLLQRKYDVVLCSHVLEHLPDPVDFLRRLRECLHPSSAFIGLVPINERKMDPHHVQAVDRVKVDEWACEAGLRVSFYVEDDPWLYWFQPVFASNQGIMRLLAQALSIGIGLPATLMAPAYWRRLGGIYSALTGSRSTQAAFVLELAQTPASR